MLRETRQIREHPYARFVTRARKPAQYLGGETGEVRKDWDAATGRICLAFPDLYEVGMSHLGYKILYAGLNAHPELLAERAYAPAHDMEALLRSEREPLRSLESWHALREFDVLGFSLQIELTYTNVLTMLDLGGVPLRADARGEDDPLVVCGGPVATHAEPLAPFVDCFLIGDGEQRTPELVLAWARAKRDGVPRAERLRRLAELPGIYVPSLYELAIDPESRLLVVTRGTVPEAKLPVVRTFLPSLAEHPFPAGGPVAATETVFDRVSVEVARGCTEGCRFCQAGMIYRPVRERPPEQIVDVIEKATTEGGYDEASLTSLSTADYSAISPLVKSVVQRLDGKRVSLSVSSLRAYGLGEDVLDEMKKNRATGLTFAPEAGTQRMRDVVNKNVTEEQLLETAERVFSRGWSKMKLYFMIGLPTEEEVDVRGIVQTGQRALEVGQRIQGRKTPRVTVSVSTHVPKPHTPFQWCAMDDQETIRAKQEMLRDEARRSDVKLRTHGSEGSWLEGVLARGDRRLADVIESAWKRGARFDSWEEHLDVDAWRESFDEHAIDTTPYLETIPVTARLPWDHLDVGLEPGFLAKEYRKALKNRLSPPCGKVVGAFIHPTNAEDALAQTKKLVCYDCGVACDLEQMKAERLVFLRTLGAEARPTEKSDEERAEITTPKQRQRVVTPDQGPALRARLAYTRLGRQAYSSHLDLVRLLPRIFRRARLPLYYSQGFHPKPVMVFGPSLPLGIASLVEHVDIKLRADLADGLDEASLLARLRDVSIEGLDFVGARLLGPNDAALGKVVDEVEYVVAFSRDALRELGVEDAAGLGALVEVRLAIPGALGVWREAKGGGNAAPAAGKRVDVSAYLREARAGEGGDALRAAGLLGDLVPLRLRLALDASGTARASEAVEALTGRADLSFRIVRTGMFGSRSGTRRDPLDAVGRSAPVATQRDQGVTA